MSKIIEVLYAPTLYRRPLGICASVVRYSDHCAALWEKEQQRAAAVRRCDELLKQLERQALLLDQRPAPAGRTISLLTRSVAFLQRGSPTPTSLAPVAGHFQALDAAERDLGREAVCVCCGNTKRIRAAMHVCLDCFNATEAERI